MANLDKSNVVNGNTISASDISALYDALTGLVTYDNIDIQGSSSYAESSSYALTSTTAASATQATSASKAIIPTPINTGTTYLTMVAGAGANTLNIDSNLEYNAGTNILIVTASYASTAETAPTPTKQYVSAGNGVNTQLGSYEMYSFAGITDAFPTSAPPALNTQHVTMSAAFPTLPVASAFGIDLWVTATAIDSDVDIIQPIFVEYDAPNKILFFHTQDGGFNGQVMYSGYVKQ